MYRSLLLMLSAFAILYGCGMPDTDDAATDAGTDDAPSPRIEPHAGGLGLQLVLPFASDTGCVLTRAYCSAEGPWPTDVTPDGTNMCSHRAGSRYNDAYALDFACAAGTPIVATADGTVAYVARDAYNWGHQVLIDHGDGVYSLYAHLDRIDVEIGRRVRQGQDIGTMGSTGYSTGPHVHFSVMRGPSPEGPFEAVVPEPLSGYEGFHDGGRRYYGAASTFANLPVGTLVKARDRPEIHVVCGDMTLCHVADWDAFAQRRFFHRANEPLVRVVTLSEEALSCYRTGMPIAGASRRALIRCGGEDHLFIEEGGRTTRRRIPFDRDADAHAYDVLLRSWGFERGEWRDGSFSECRAPRGADLLLRDGTLIELASDNDFYVVTADAFENEAIGGAGHGYVMRVHREVDGEPFMPLLYRSYGQVLIVPDDAVFTMTAGAFHGKNRFGPELASMCRYGPGFSGGGGPYDGVDGPYVPEAPGDAPACTEGARRCDDAATYAVCVAGDDGVPRWDPWPCPEGWSCDPSDGMCWEDAVSVPDADPPHTIRCTATDDALRVRITGPVLDALITRPSRPVSLQYGADTDGWTVPYATGTKPSVAWTGDGTYELDLPSSTDRFNVKVVDGDDPAADTWFDLDVSLDGVVPWHVAGACARDGTVIVRVPEGDSSPPDPPDGTDVPSRTIHCERTADALVVRIRGPILDALHGGTVASPAAIQYGSNSPYQWSLPYDAGSTRASVGWRGDDEVHDLALPPHADGLNLFVVDAAGGGRWFDLDAADGDGVPWTVTGDCVLDGTLISTVGP